MASRAALLLCAAVCLFATAMAAEEFADLAELNTPLTDSIFHPETMVKIASDDKYGYYKRVHKKSSKGKGYKEEEHKKTEYKPKKVEHKKEEHKKEEHKEEHKKPEDNEYPPEGEVYEKDGYELVDGYYYHGEPKPSKEYKDYEAEYPEYSNYPDKFLPKVCIQSLPTNAQQDALIAWLNSTSLVGPVATSTLQIGWDFGCCCHGEDEGYSKEYKPSTEYDSDYGDYLTNGYAGKNPTNPDVCSPKKIGSCNLKFTAGGLLKHLSPNCDKLNITVEGTCEITEKEAKKCIPFGHYDGEEKVTFDIKEGWLFKIGVGIPTPGANVGSYDSDDYYSQYPYVLTNAASKISAQTAQSSKVSIASANGKRHHKDDEEYYGADGESEYEPAPYPSAGIERGWALTLLAKLKDFEQCIHDLADCHKSKTVEGGMLELVLATYDTNCKTTAGNPVGAGVPIFIAGTSCAATNTPVPVCKWGSGKLKLRKTSHDYGYGYGKEYKEYKPTPSYKEEEKKEKKVYKKDEKKY